jgi:hypothetical protein
MASVESTLEGNIAVVYIYWDELAEFVQRHRSPNQCATCLEFHQRWGVSSPLGGWQYRLSCVDTDSDWRALRRAITDFVGHAFATSITVSRHGPWLDMVAMLERPRDYNGALLDLFGVAVEEAPTVLDAVPALLADVVVQTNQPAQDAAPAQGPHVADLSTISALAKLVEQHKDGDSGPSYYRFSQAPESVMNSFMKRFIQPAVLAQLHGQRFETPSDVVGAIIGRVNPHHPHLNLRLDDHGQLVGDCKYCGKGIYVLGAALQANVSSHQSKCPPFQSSNPPVPDERGS